MERSTLESQGILSSAILAFVEEAEERLDALHSVMVARNGQVVAEGWWAPYTPDLNHWLFSLSKGFTSTGVGIAIGEGRLNLDDAVISFFPDEAPKAPSENLKAMTVRDLLKMTHGHKGNADRKVMRSDDPAWTRNWLAFDVAHTPGTRWAYSNSVTYMLSAILQKVTGERLVDYMKRRLFDPLGITKPIWDESPEGVSLGGSGLRVRTEDVLRLGQLYLQNGKWEGKQIVPESWVAEATKVQATPPPNDPMPGMGYYFMVFPDHEAFGAGGLFGQSCTVVPNTNGVVAITAGVRHGRMQTIDELVWKHLSPAMGASPLAEDEVASVALVDKMRSLSLPVQEGRPDSPLAGTVSGRKFAFPENDRGITSLTLEVNADRTVLTLADSRGEHQITCGQGEWTTGRTSFEHLPL
jgi:CubicO group peptidase (beta-lactamase class C family)